MYRGAPALSRLSARTLGIRDTKALRCRSICAYRIPRIRVPRDRDVWHPWQRDYRCPGCPAIHLPKQPGIRMLRHPDTRMRPCGRGALLPFLGCKLCFCTYSPAMPCVPTKTNLPRSLAPSGTAAAPWKGKSSQLAFSSGRGPTTRKTKNKNAMLRHGSLFSGIGGFDIAAEWTGWQNVFSCEKDAFCRTVLKHHWPKTLHYEDIHDFNAIEFRGRVDVISGGVPCQPFSQAGRRGGKADDRYLFPEALRIISEVRPRWVVLENVAGLFSILEPEGLSEMEVQAVELFCQDGEQQTNSTILRIQRRVIGSILTEIESAGYFLPRLDDGTPIVLCIPACAVNAPHRRDRVWFVAHTGHDADRADAHRYRYAEGDRAADEGWRTETAIDQGRADYHGIGTRVDTDGDGHGQYRSDSTDGLDPGKRGQPAQRDPQQAGIDATQTGKHRTGRPGRTIPDWDVWPIQSPIRGRNDGIPSGLDGITLSKWTEESIKAYGNAIVPQVALEIFRAIQEVTIRQTGHGI